MKQQSYYNHIEQFTFEEQNYLQQLKQNPKQIFFHISMERIHLWEEFLFSSQYQYIPDEQLIDDIFLTELNQKNQRIIHNDCLRTRLKESHLISSFVNILEQYITYYCQHKEIVYKQGLNEIIGPFILLRYILPIPYDKLIHLFSAFIDKFFTNYFRELSLTSLHSSLSLLVILLRYHLPSIYNIFENNMISSEMYGTGWIMTGLGSKLRLDCLYHLWDHLIRINDPIFLHFIIVAMLKLKKDQIEKCDESILPVVISKLSINSLEEVDTVMQIALELRRKTPYSFRILSNRLNIFNYDKLNELQKAKDTYMPEHMLAMPIFSSEIFYITYRKFVKCPDNQCIYNELSKTKMNKKTICEHCDLEQFKTINYALLDLRLIRNGPVEEKASFLPMMIMVPQNELKTDDFHDYFSKRFENDKEIYHFILLTNKTDYFFQYETEFYLKRQTHENKYNILQSSVTKTPTKIDFNLLNSLSQEQITQLKEYDNLKRSIFSLVNKNYPYISYIYGGFEEIHDESFKNLQTPLLNHSLNCSLCNEKSKKVQLTYHNKNSEMKNAQKVNQSKFVLHCNQLNSSLGKSLWERKTKIRNEEISTLNNYSNSFVFHCLLNEINNIKTKGRSIIVIINSFDILIYQNNEDKEMDIKARVDNTQKELCLIKYIELFNIISLRMKKPSNHIMILKCIDDDVLPLVIIIDFLIDKHSILFLNTLKKFINPLQMIE